MSGKTSLDTLNYSEEDDCVVYDIQEIKNLVQVNDYYQLFEKIRQLCSEYESSPVYLLEEFLIRIVKETDLAVSLKIEIAKSYHKIQNDDSLLLLVSRDPWFLRLIFNQQLEVLKLISDSNFVVGFIQAKLKKENVLNSLKILKSIASKDFPFDITKSLFIEYINSSSVQNTHEQIVACEHLILEKNCDSKTRTELFDILLRISRDKTVRENIRANAVDLLLEFDETMKEANEILEELGQDNFNIYHNRQNIHNSKIKKSAYEIVKHFYKLKSTALDQYNFIIVQNEIKNLNTSAQVLQALEEISLRQQDIIPDFNLPQLLVCLWYYIHSQEDVSIKELLLERLLNELEEMGDTCKTGHTIRLCNVTSGITFSIQISWEDQIKSNLTGRLMARLKKLKEYGDIAADMAESKQENKKIFNKYFIQYVPEIKNELFFEFVNAKYVTAEEFDLYFRNAILSLQS